ncbi:MAG: type II toxin-antitoxin system VapC family toxin [Pirellulales bacterium]|nr:type II toxin-antitoxin system VapC family toxin [Pirellulales bacterium]
MTVVDPIFIDTNILVFATIPGSPFHRPAIQALHGIAQSGSVGWISRQVIREYLVQLTRPGILPIPLSLTDLPGQINALQRIYQVANETPQVTLELLGFIQNGLAAGKQIHDANIVATCIAYKIPRLLTHNMADFKRYSSVLHIETL